MDLTYFLIFAFYAFATGACVASFLNVCIWRLPRNESVISPGSHCPECNAAIPWYRNIPVLSYIALRGRCADCGKRISPRYIAVELLGGLLFLAVYLQWAGPATPCVGNIAMLRPFSDFRSVPACWLAVSGLILGSFIDISHFYLPDRVTIGGMAAGLALSALVPELQMERTAAGALCWSAAGLLSGFFLLWGVGWIFSRLFKKEALGFGDVKLMGAVGAFFGPAAVLFVMIASSVAGSVFGIAMMAKGKARLGSFTAVPYGPFIAFATLLWIYWGPGLVAWYVSLLAKGGI